MSSGARFAHFRNDSALLAVAHLELLPYHKRLAPGPPKKAPYTYLVLCVPC